MREIWDKVDFHANNQKDWKLPSRDYAKRFIFKILYGGSAYGFSNDPEFSWISSDPNFWQRMIDAFYEKYLGIAQWHTKIVQMVISEGKLVMPTGREYEFKPFRKPSGELKWPRTQILNYPVQGLGADLVAIARVTIRKRLIKEGLYKLVKLQSTVHDSIDIDVPTGVDNNLDLCYTICRTCEKAVNDVPTNFERLFKTPFNLPLNVEVKYGKNLGDLSLYAPN